jgi:8-oxo-dGTP pyrophosphatase MutT (NUDIX family)
MYPVDLRRRLADALGPEPRVETRPGDRLAGVVVPIVEPAGDALDAVIVFTKRTEHLSRHAGEISFPGGIRHEEDADLRATALRESDEELGLAASDLDVVGALPAVHTFVSSIVIVPFVGILRARPVFRPSAAEIAEVLEYGLTELAAAERIVEFRRDEGVYRGYAYEMGAHTIWGATARILHDLLEVLRAQPHPREETA